MKINHNKNRHYIPNVKWPQAISNPAVHDTTNRYSRHMNENLQVFSVLCAQHKYLGHRKRNTRTINPNNIFMTKYFHLIIGRFQKQKNTNRMA